MKRYKRYGESSLSRVWKHTTQHDSGTISAFRYAQNCGQGKRYSLSENKVRNNKLKAWLLSLGYGVTPIDGVYIENYGTDKAVEVAEESFLVIDLNDTGKLKQSLIKIGEHFEQDSITFSEAKGDYYIISSNKCETGYPGFGKVGVEKKLGKPMFSQSGEFHSKVNGRPFVFKEYVNERVDVLTEYSISEIRSIKELAKQAKETKDVCTIEDK